MRDASVVTALNRPPITSVNQSVPDIRIESKIVRKFVAISVALHIIAFVVSTLKLIHTPPMPQEEFGIETELISDLNWDTTSKTKIPDIETAPEAAVPKNLLPQLPKNFAVEDSAPKADDSSLVDPEKTEPVPTNTSTTTGTGTDTNPALTQIKKTEDNKLAQREALKRLATELLRQQQKQDASKVAAPDSASAAQVKNAETGDATTGAPGVGNLAALRRYESILHKAIKRNYSLPSTYKTTTGQLQATVLIKIAANGDVQHAEISRSSNDRTFDELILQAVKISSPLPKPPEDAVDRPIEIVFSQ